MKVVQINATCGVGSTGKICVAVAKLLESYEIQNHILYAGKKVDSKYGIRCAGKNYLKLQALKSRIFGNFGFNSKLATKRIISYLNGIKPDIVHLHNLHGHNCNMELLFNYLKTNKIKVYWTFHDCWSFTGYCTHFLMAKCDKWKVGCSDCPQRKKFSWFFDKSSKLYQRKKILFLGLDMTIITPSDWLAGLVKKSFLSDYPVKVINNGINLEVFKPTPSSFRRKYGIEENKKIILGVSFGWGKSKGLDVFLELEKRLDKEKYQIVLVGTDKKVEKILPNSIISIHRTNNQKELAEIYTAADAFINPTREENYPTVHMEAIACGCPVISFDTGGCKEMLEFESGIVVPTDDIDKFENMIISCLENGDFIRDKVRACATKFDEKICYQQVVDIYLESM